MPTKKRSSRNQTSIKVGDISGVSGNVNIAGGDITITTGLSGAEIKQLFDQVFSAIQTRPETSPSQKEDLQAEVQEIQSTVTQAARSEEGVDESFLSRRFRNIARMAPDILDVVVTTLANHALGIGEVVRKIAQKAKEETKA